MKSSNAEHKAAVKPMTRQRALQKLTTGALVFPAAVWAGLGAPDGATAKDAAPQVMIVVPAT